MQESVRPRASLLTLGCKVNQYESGRVAEELWRGGFDIAASPEEDADVCVINTCTITHVADAKSRQSIRRLKRQNPRALVVVTGCATESDRASLEAIEEIDLIVGNLEKERVAERIFQRLADDGRPPPPEREAELLPRGQDRTRALLKVQDGCDHRCSYCIIPNTRGHARSVRWDDLLAETKRLAVAGHKELIITGICVGSYHDAGRGLPDLLDALSGIDGIQRLRISSIEPTDITDALIERMAANPKICRHLHLCLQSGDDGILRAMRRPYDSAGYIRRAERLQADVPGINLTTDVIVGFPGETEAQFANTTALVQRVGFSKLHVFTYSPRAGTPAAELPGAVDERVRQSRSKALLELSREGGRAFALQNVGRTVEVLVESGTPREGWATGLTDTYLRVSFPASSTRHGHLVPVRVERARDENAEGIPAA